MSKVNTSVNAISAMESAAAHTKKQLLDHQRELMEAFRSAKSGWNDIHRDKVEDTLKLHFSALCDAEELLDRMSAALCGLRDIAYEYESLK